MVKGKSHYLGDSFLSLTRVLLHLNGLTIVNYMIKF